MIMAGHAVEERQLYYGHLIVPCHGGKYYVAHDSCLVVCVYFRHDRPPTSLVVRTHPLFLMSEHLTISDCLKLEFENTR